MNAPAGTSVQSRLSFTEEEQEDSEEEDVEGLVGPCHFSETDVAQAFSHFTWRYTKRTMLVCDLQGVFDRDAQPHARCEFTDPVIHYASASGRKNRFGRTDCGRKGVSEFFKTHICSELCRILHRRWLTARGDQFEDVDLETLD